MEGTGGYLPFPFLHRTHRCLHNGIVAVDLILEVLPALSKMLECLVHAVHLLLSLDTFPVLRTNIQGNSIQNALKAVGSRDFSLSLQFQEIRDGQCFDFAESQPRNNEMKEARMARNVLPSDVF